jgi:hypothetical protein
MVAGVIRVQINQPGLGPLNRRLFPNPNVGGQLGD